LARSRSSLLFTIVVISTLKGEYIGRCRWMFCASVALLICLVARFLVSFYMARNSERTTRRPQRLRLLQPRTFCTRDRCGVAIFGIGSRAAFAAVSGPLVEVPVMIVLVSVAFYSQRRYFVKAAPPQMEPIAASAVK
jgi:arsenite transporter